MPFLTGCYAACDSVTEGCQGTAGAHHVGPHDRRPESALSHTGWPVQVHAKRPQQAFGRGRTDAVAAAEPGPSPSCDQAHGRLGGRARRGHGEVAAM
jgi:hypothetical protein